MTRPDMTLDFSELDYDLRERLLVALQVRLRGETAMLKREAADEDHGIQRIKANEAMLGKIAGMLKE